MSMIEGIGDEVVHFFTVVTVIFLALLAWWSTSITEGPLIRTVLILERRTRGRITNDSSNPQISITSSENSIDTGQGNPAGIQELVETDTVGSGNNGDDKEENESGSSLLLPTNQPAAVRVDESTPDVDESRVPDSSQSPANTLQVLQENNDSTSETSDSDSTVLRRRRLAFFQSRGPTLLDSSPADGSNENTANTDGDNDTHETQGATAEEVRDQSSTGNPDNIRIRLKYLNDDQIVVEGRLQEQLGDFKRRHFSLELAAEKMVRLIFNGQVLQSDSQTLQGYGLFDNCVVHCLVHNQRNSSPRSPQSQTNGSSNQSSPPDWNLGTLLYTCLSVILGFAWYCRFQYSHLFTLTTTAALLGLTGMFVVTLLSMYLPDHETIQ